MSKRMDAIWRVIALLWVGLIGYIGGTIFGIIAIIWMILDVLWQFIAGSDGLSSSGTVGSWLRGYIGWTADMSAYAITGAGSFDWLPSKA